MTPAFVVSNPASCFMCTEELFRSMQLFNTQLKIVKCSTVEGKIHDSMPELFYVKYVGHLGR